MSENMRYQAWKTLKNGQKIEADNLLCPTELYLCTKFQIWAEAVGCTHKEGLAMFLADDRALLAEYFWNPEKGKVYAQSGFKKIESKKIPNLTHFNTPIKVEFGQPDKFGEISTSISLPLDIKKKVKYVTLQIDGGDPAVYRLDYEDAGTIGYARMNDQWAITGRLTNISMDWTNPHPRDFGIINVIGTVERGQARLTIWQTEAQVLERTQHDIKDTVADGDMEIAAFFVKFMQETQPKMVKTTRQKFEYMIFSLGVFEDMAKKIIDYAIPKVEEMLGSKNTIDWNGDADGYPDVFYSITFETNIKPAALEWIEANLPEAWFKKLFVTKF